MKTTENTTLNATVYIQLTDRKHSRVPVYSKPGDAGADVYSVPRKKEYSEDKIADFAYRSGLGEMLDENLEEAAYEKGDYVLPPGCTELIDLGLKIEMHRGWEMQVRSRSGMAKRGLVVANAPGTIDSGYRGPCMVLLHNNTNFYRIIKPGVRVAQFVLKRAPQAVFLPVDELDKSERGEGGWGSTGTK